MKKIGLLIFLLSLLLMASCGDKKTANSKAAPEIKKGVAPIVDNEMAVIEMENSSAYGTIKLELYSNIAPKMVARFKELAKAGVYDGTTFHRINESVIQGGDPLSKDGNPANDGTGRSDKPNVDAEFSDLKYDTGILGAARGQDNNSANSQFFITLKREAGFDNKYTIFGKVVDGMNNVMTIAGVQPKAGEHPLEAVTIKHISFVPREEAK
ncbi:MAG: peptidylprolyl isomerase [Pyrinomonadaceae bacterium]